MLSWIVAGSKAMSGFFTAHFLYRH